MPNGPPKSDEIELSLFGPGVGECIVLHVGNGKWIVVDSCLDVDGELPIAVRYLTSLGVDISRQVELIVATHWHDDHIRGLGQLVGLADAAKFACSAAFMSDQFLRMVLGRERNKECQSFFFRCGGIRTYP